MDKVITIPKKIANEDDLIIISRKRYEELLRSQKVTEKDVLRWAKEARMLKKVNKLPELKSWTDLKK